jgi:hypothetical protein
MSQTYRRDAAVIRSSRDARQPCHFVDALFITCSIPPLTAANLDVLASPPVHHVTRLDLSPLRRDRTCSDGGPLAPGRGVRCMPVAHWGVERRPSMVPHSQGSPRRPPARRQRAQSAPPTFSTCDLGGACCRIGCRWLWLTVLSRMEPCPAG